MQAQKSWSMLDHRPVLKYVPECDDYIVYWNGIVIPHKMALCYAGTLLNIYPTPEMRKELTLNYKKLYCAGALGLEGDWSHRMKGHADMFGFVNRYIQDHLNSLKEQNIPKEEILGWFDYSRAVSD